MNNNITKLISGSILGKRTYSNSFNSDTYDDERYGQHISGDFFETNTGHITKNNNLPNNTPIIINKINKFNIIK